MTASRPDHDAPRPGERYVVRIEDADGRRLKVTASDEEADGLDVTARRRLLLAKCEHLIERFVGA